MTEREYCVVQVNTKKTVVSKVITIASVAFILFLLHARKQVTNIIMSIL